MTRGRTAKPKGPVLDVAVESGLWDALPDAEAIAARAVGAAAAGCGVTLARSAEVSLMLTDDAQMRGINRQWRAKDNPTNVLSFPAASADGLAKAPFLGDIAVAFETVAREASEEGKTLADHFAHLVVHGFLHLVGYDHETEEQAQEMEGLEVAILAGLGIADPYAEDEAKGRLAS